MSDTKKGKNDQNLAQNINVLPDTGGVEPGEGTSDRPPQLIVINTQGLDTYSGVKKLPSIGSLSGLSTTDPIITVQPDHFSSASYFVSQGAMIVPVTGTMASSTGYSADAKKEIIDQTRETILEPAKDAPENVINPALALAGGSKTKEENDSGLRVFICLCGFIFGLLSCIFLCIAKRAEAKGDIKKAQKYLLLSVIMKLVGTVVAILGLIGFAIAIPCGILGWCGNND